MPVASPFIHIATEFLSINIKDNKAIHGLEFNDYPHFETKTAQMQMILQCLQDMLSVNNVLKEIDRFSSVFGIVMNKQETKGIWLRLIRTAIRVLISDQLLVILVETFVVPLN